MNGGEQSQRVYDLLVLSQLIFFVYYVVQKRFSSSFERVLDISLRVPERLLCKHSSVIHFYLHLQLLHITRQICINIIKKTTITYTTHMMFLSKVCYFHYIHYCDVLLYLPVLPRSKHIIIYP